MYLLRVARRLCFVKICSRFLALRHQSLTPVALASLRNRARNEAPEEGTADVLFGW